MNYWIPINKQHGPSVAYLPVSDAEKAAMEADPMTKGKYTFQAVAPESAPKAAKPKAEKVTPVGVEIPDEPKQ